MNISILRFIRVTGLRYLLAYINTGLFFHISACVYRKLVSGFVGSPQLSEWKKLFLFL